MGLMFPELSIARSDAALALEEAGGSLRKLESPFLFHKLSAEPGEPVPCEKSVVSPVVLAQGGWARFGPMGIARCWRWCAACTDPLVKRLANVPWGSTMLDQVSPWCPGAVADLGTLSFPLRWQRGSVHSFRIICISGSYPAAHAGWMVLCWGNPKISKQDRKKAKPTHT